MLSTGKRSTERDRDLWLICETIRVGSTRLSDVERVANASDFDKIGCLWVL